MTLHKDLLNILYSSYYQTKKTTDEIRGLFGIDHFSLDIADPNGMMLFFSNTPAHGFEICKRGYAQYDGIISPRHYKSHEFYWWKNAAHKKYSDKIEEIRQGVLGLRDGFMLVRRWNGFYIIYSFATRTKSDDFKFSVVNNLNEYLAIGDYVYDNLRAEYSRYCTDFDPPTIEKFYPFEGGEPPARHTKDYKKPSGPNKIILIDFRDKKIALPNNVIAQL